MNRSVLAVFAAALVIGPTAQAQISPHGDTFGSLPAATFGGTGIPNDWVQYSIFDGVTIGLTAHQRFSNPALTNDGAGTFSAQSGYDLGNSCGVAGFTCATWNFAYFIGGPNASLYNYNLLFDLDPAAGNLDMGLIPSPILVGVFGFENSENLAFGFLQTFFSPPGHGPFDPTVAGTYNFQLEMYDGNAALVNSVGIEVLVDGGASTVPEPASMTLLATGLAGLAAARKRKNRAS